MSDIIVNKPVNTGTPVVETDKINAPTLKRNDEDNSTPKVQEKLHEPKPNELNSVKIGQDQENLPKLSLGEVSDVKMEVLTEITESVPKIDPMEKFQQKMLQEKSGELTNLKGKNEVLSGTTKTVTQDGSGKKISTLTGGKLSELENNLNNPVSTDERNRLGMVDRQEKIMKAAEKADPFMRELEGGGDLSKTHTKSTDTLQNTGTKKKPKWEPKTGDSWGTDNKLKDDSTGLHKYSYGAEEYGNSLTQGNNLKPKTGKGGVIIPPKWTNPTDAAEKLLPELQNRPTGYTPSPGDGVTSRTGVWSESDLNPRQKDTTKTDNTAEGRDAERLLFTSGDSEVSDNIVRSKTSSTPVPTKKVDHKFYITTDHYQSSVPITPVEKDYKANNDYKSPYMDPEGKLNSLQYQKKLEEESKNKTDTV